MDQSFINSTVRMNRAVRHRQARKIIKRYGNRKLYDTEQSSYVILTDIAKMIRNEEDILIIDNETKDDITASTLTQIIFGAERERQSSQSAPLNILKSIIKTGDGSFSSYLSKKAKGMISPQIKDAKMNIKEKESKRSKRYKVKKERLLSEFQHKTLQERVASAALASDSLSSNEDTILPTSRSHIMEKK